MLLDYEDDAIAAERAGKNVSYVDPAPDDPHPEPDRCAHELEPQGCGPGIRELPPFRGGPGALGEERDTVR